MLLLCAGSAFAPPIPPDLRIAYTNGPSKASPGQTNLGYYAMVNNNGGQTASFADGTVVAKQTVTGGTTTYCSAFTEGYTCQGIGTDTIEVVADGTQTLGVGQPLEFFVLVDAPSSTPGKITYSVTADPDNAIAEIDETNNASDTIATYIGDPPPTDLAVTQTDDPDPAETTDQVKYTVDVTNEGQDTAFNVLVYNALSANVTYDFGYSDAGNCNFIASYNTAVCPLGNLLSGKSSEIKIYAIPKARGTISNTATVYSDYGDPEPSNDTDKEETKVGTPPSPPIITSPANNSYDTDGYITLSGTSEASSNVKLYEGTLLKGTDWADSNGKWSIELSGVANGRHSYTATATDDYDNVSSPSAARTIIVDTVKPKGTLIINNGAASTKSRTVTLYTRASDPAPASGVAYMRFRNYPSTTWSGWFPYASSKSWILSAGKGTKYVYVQYKDRAGNVSAQAYDGIKYAP